MSGNAASTANIAPIPGREIMGTNQPPMACVRGTDTVTGYVHPHQRVRQSMLTCIRTFENDSPSPARPWNEARLAARRLNAYRRRTLGV